MTNEHRSAYPGCLITTRCSETRRPTDWAELEALPSIWATRFTASFSVSQDDARGQAWQEFPSYCFRSCEEASDSALLEAKRAIDFRLAEV
jgi:hypothetical protein